MRKTMIAAVCAVFYAALPSAPTVPAADPFTGEPVRKAEAAAAFIDRYCERLTFMVVISDAVRIPAGDEEVYRRAVAAANDYLTAQNLPVVFQDQVEKLRRDERALADDVLGGPMSVTQWLAQKLNADVYIEIDVMFRSEKRGTQWYAQANLTLNVFEPSTGRLLGSVSYSPIDRVIGASEQLAKTNAVQIGIRHRMGEVIRLARENIRREVVNGIRYELKLVHKADAEATDAFIDALKRFVLPSGEAAVTDIELRSRTESGGTWFIRFFGTPDEFGRMVLHTAKTIPGLEGMTLILQRGKSFSFAAGTE